MVLVSSLLAYLGGRPTPPAVPLCPCGAAADDRDGAALCGACLLRRADLAARPHLFEDQVVAGAVDEHGDVVHISSIAVDAHMHVTQVGLLIHARSQVAWEWTAEWPTDDRTLDDILETRALERLWGAA